MIQNGLYFLVHLAMLCPQTNNCVLQQTILDVQTNKEICYVLRDKMKHELPKETFSCVQIQAI